MSPKKIKTARSYVEHPRYGDKPLWSRFVFSKEEIEKAHFCYRQCTYFAESAIPADIEKQNYSLYPRTIYVDLEKQCVQCQRWFIFYAEEQKHWYETLHFYIDSDCVKCCECRKLDQQQTHLVREYETLLKIENRNVKEKRRFEEVVAALAANGYIKNAATKKNL